MPGHRHAAPEAISTSEGPNAPSAYRPRGIPGRTGSRRRGLLYRGRARRSARSGVTLHMPGIPWPPCKNRQNQNKGPHDGGERSAVNPAFRFFGIVHACSPVRLVQSRTACPAAALSIAGCQGLHRRLCFGPCFVNRVSGHGNVGRIGARHLVDDGAVLGERIQHDVECGFCFRCLGEPIAVQRQQQDNAQQTSLSSLASIACFTGAKET